MTGRSLIREKTEGPLEMTRADRLLVFDLQMKTWQAVNNGSLRRHVQNRIDALGISVSFRQACMKYSVDNC